MGDYRIVVHGVDNLALGGRGVIKGRLLYCMKGLNMKLLLAE